jgi:hypothetical protein
MGSLRGPPISLGKTNLTGTTDTRLLRVQRKQRPPPALSP